MSSTYKPLFLACALAFGLAAATPAMSADHSNAARVAPKNAPKPVVAAEPLTPEQQRLASQVEMGKIPCELGQQVEIQTDPQTEGRFILMLGKQRYHMHPVASSSGAIRLEDAQSNVIWLQLGNKSMLMDQKAGKRLADACMTQAQMAVHQALESNPSSGLLAGGAAPMAAASAPANAVETVAVTPKKRKHKNVALK
jgi:hypothetical protein